MTPPHRASRRLQRSTPDRETLCRENERLRQQVEELRQRLREQAERITEDERRIVEKEKQIADLERQLALRNQNSTNSSKPPSSDGLAGPPREGGRLKKSRRKAGGQPGHRGAHRPLAEKADEIRAVLPEQCQHCGHGLPAKIEQAQTTGSPQRHQVTELPPIQARIIEYRCHRVVCPECGESTRAGLPLEARGQFGPQRTALIAYLTVVCRMPRRVVEALLEQVLGIEISLGSTQKCWEEASEAVAAPCRELERQLKDEPVLNIDETGWRTNGDKRFLWAFSGGTVHRLYGGGNPRQRSADPPARRSFQRHLMQRPIQRVLEISLRQSTVLLGTFKAQPAGDRGTHQEQCCRALLPGCAGRACQAIPAVAQISRRPDQPAATRAPVHPDPATASGPRRAAFGQSSPRGSQSGNRSVRA